MSQMGGAQAERWDCGAGAQRAQGSHIALSDALGPRLWAIVAEPEAEAEKRRRDTSRL
jgi:hypothetical protein